jgi:selenide,water dikinase
MMLHNPHACTDVTGFGLIGHCCEMAKGAGVTIRLTLADIPLMAGLSGLVADGMVPAGCYRNRDYYSPKVETGLPADLLLPLFDPQTSGGLLIAFDPADAALFLAAAADSGIFACQVGEVSVKASKPVVVC